MFDFSERDKRRLEQLINSKSTDLEWLEFEVKILRFALSLISDSVNEGSSDVEVEPGVTQTGGEYD